jgi:cytoskeletal protein RodZ
MGMVLQHQHPGLGFGDFLRGARERRGLTLRQVSSETKIPWRHLDAIEHGDLTVVPNRLYRRAEVRAYARAVGLDQNLALAELEQAVTASGLDVDPQAQSIDGAGSSTSHPVLTTLGVTAVVAVLLAVAQWWNPQQPAARAQTEAPLTTSASSSAAAPVADSPAVPNSRVAEGARSAVAPSSSTTREESAGTVSGANDLASAVPASAPVDAMTAPVSKNALVVTTEPAGARVMVDGIGWGTTPVSVRYLTPGDKTVRVIKDGYASEERTVRIAPGRGTNLHVSLRSAAN